MNISKLHPISYTAKTTNGNEYKKSNIGKTLALVTGVGVNACLESAKNSVFKAFSTRSMVTELKVKNPKIKTALSLGAIALDLVSFYLVGSLIDKKISKKRAQKADLKA